MVTCQKPFIRSPGLLPKHLKKSALVASSAGQNARIFEPLSPATFHQKNERVASVDKSFLTPSLQKNLSAGATAGAALRHLLTPSAASLFGPLGLQKMT